MPIIVTFDLVKPTPDELNRIRSFFARLGWEHLGNTAYRYPKLHGKHPAEDWFNHVIPALMLLRAFARSATTAGRDMGGFSIDVQSSTGMNPESGVGTPPLPGGDIIFSQPTRSGHKFGLRNLIAWIDGITWPYASAGPGTPGSDTTTP